MVTVVKHFDFLSYETEGSGDNGSVQTNLILNNIKHSMFQKNASFVQCVGLQA